MSCFFPSSPSPSLSPFSIQASNPMRATLGPMYTYPFFFPTYCPKFKCQVKQPFQAICGSAVAMDQSCTITKKNTCRPVAPVVFV